MECLENGEVACTAVGASKIEHVSVVDSPSSVLVRRDVVELSNYTKWELCDYLLNMDWSVKPMPSKKQHRVLPLETVGPVVKDEGKIIYAR